MRKFHLGILLRVLVASASSISWKLCSVRGSSRCTFSRCTCLSLFVRHVQQFSTNISSPPALPFFFLLFHFHSTPHLLMESRIPKSVQPLAHFFNDSNCSAPVSSPCRFEDPWHFSRSCIARSVQRLAYFFNDSDCGTSVFFPRRFEAPWLFFLRTRSGRLQYKHPAFIFFHHRFLLVKDVFFVYFIGSELMASE